MSRLPDPFARAQRTICASFREYLPELRGYARRVRNRYLARTFVVSLLMSSSCDVAEAVGPYWNTPQPSGVGKKEGWPL